MKNVSKILTLAAASAALSIGVLGATPALAFNSPYDDQRMALSHQGFVDYDQDVYDRPAPYVYDRPAYGVGSGVIAICPPGYHLGRGRELCWPN